MFSKRKSTTTYYDNEYKILFDVGYKFQDALMEAVQMCLVKERKTHLFPTNTESYTRALEEYKKAQLNVWTAQSDYAVALGKIKEYYEMYHQDFIECRTYLKPDQWWIPDYVIEQAIRKGI